MKYLKSVVRHSFFLAGTIVLITMFVIVSLNFSRDARLFAKSEPEPKPAAKPIATQVPADTEEQENFGTIKYERKGFNIGEGDGSDSGISKKLAGAKIEIINCSGNEKAGEKLRADLKKMGINATVTETDSINKTDTTGDDAKTDDADGTKDKTDKTGDTGKTDETGNADKTSETGTADKADETIITDKASKQENEKVENRRNDLRDKKEASVERYASVTTRRPLPSATSKAALKHTAIPTARHTLKSTPVQTPMHTPTPEYTPVQTPDPLHTPGYSTGNTATGGLKTGDEPTHNAVQSESPTPGKENSDSTTVDKTLIIERNDKQLGAELKKIIKAGTIKKEVNPDYGYDVTIILGKDYIN